MFLDAFAAPTVSSSRRTQSAYNFVRTRMDEIADDWNLTANAEGLLNPAVVHILPLLPFLFSSREEIDYKKHRRSKHKFMVRRTKDQAKP